MYSRAASIYGGTAEIQRNIVADQVLGCGGLMFDTEIAAEFRRSVAAALDPDDPVKARTALIEAGWLDALEADEAMAVARSSSVSRARHP